MKINRLSMISILGTLLYVIESDAQKEMPCLGLGRIPGTQLMPLNRGNERPMNQEWRKWISSAIPLLNKTDVFTQWLIVQGMQRPIQTAYEQTESAIGASRSLRISVLGLIGHLLSSFCPNYLNRLEFLYGFPTTPITTTNLILTPQISYVQREYIPIEYFQDLPEDNRRIQIRIVIMSQNRNICY